MNIWSGQNKCEKLCRDKGFKHSKYIAPYRFNDGKCICEEPTNDNSSNKKLELDNTVLMTQHKTMRTLYTLLTLYFIVISNFAHAQSFPGTIAESHIQANVPEATDFDKFMLRDLEAYFTNQTGHAVQVKFEFLREGPTQTGVAYPKFYLWIRLTDKNKSEQEGAVRVAAIEKKRFEVTDYMKASEIKKNPDAIYRVFPRPVGNKILEKIK